MEPGGGFLGPEDRIEHHTRTLDRAIQLTFIADAKAAPVLALQATLAAVTVSQIGSLGELFDGSNHSAGGVALAWVLLAGYVATAAVAWVLASLVFVPRAPRRNATPPESRSRVYFDDIRATPAADFRERGKLIHEEELEDDLLTQVHVVSTIAGVKFAQVQRAFIASAASLVFWLTLLIWARV